MDVTSFVTSAAMIISQTNVKQQVNVTLMKTALNSAESRSTDLLKVMEQSVLPHIGGKVDLKG